MVKEKKSYVIKKILVKFKSKNGVPLFAYDGIWHGACGDEKVHYIEREDTREYIDSFTPEGEVSKFMDDEPLKEKIKELKKRFILKYFELIGFSQKQYRFHSIYNEYDKSSKKDEVNEIVKEIELLTKNKEPILFNEDFGVGELIYKKGKYLIELHVYGDMSYPLGTRNLKKVAKWLIGFSNQDEGFDYGKGFSTTLSTDMMTSKDRDDLIKNRDQLRRKEINKIK